MSATARIDVYRRVTDEIIAAIEAGPGRFRMPWHHDGAAVSRPVNLASGKAYRGINTVTLWAAAQANGYASGVWATYRQWLAKGAQVRKGEHASLAVLWKDVRRDDDATGDEVQEQKGRPRVFARGFAVFNADQVDGYVPAQQAILPEAERLAQADTFIANLGVKTVFGGSQAYYMPSSDTVFMPPFSNFRDAASFAAVWLHEMGHASGAKHRLDRDLTGRFGSAAYAAEECAVEILSGFVLADLGIAHYPRPDHAAYIASWLEVLKNDPRAIFTAASKAQQAADWMHARQPDQSATAAA
ncbi:ArdC family protein [Phenylobacterium sp. VNQ135]|uniref:ArdC family protein n=1 Tax=Phenylobacterium sp. VNQ135 TaxID=3400922 RepID=UPI003C05CD52